MDWANYETSISLRGAFLAGVMREDIWNNDWFMEIGRRLITKEVGQIGEHLQCTGAYITGETSTVANIPLGLVLNSWYRLQIDQPKYPTIARYY